MASASSLPMIFLPSLMGRDPDPANKFCPSVRDELARLEGKVQCRLAGRIRDLAIFLGEQGLVLQGHTSTYYAKQLAQQAVMEATNRPIYANEIKVA